ncbi:MAG: hypothetical protein IIA89_03200 [Chloroflexi bacterium]|nr:hypothetical protein [Chloroflexota bacterium]
MLFDKHGTLRLVGFDGVLSIEYEDRLNQRLSEALQRNVG